MTNFLVGVLASLVAGVLLVGFTAAASKRARWLLTGILGRLLGVDIEAVFSDKRNAETDIRTELTRAREVAIFTGRGNELQRDTFDPIFLHRPSSKPVRVRVLLPVTDVPQGFDWTGQRETELAQFDHAFGRRGLLREQIETTVRFLDEYVNSGKAELRRFDVPHSGRLVITERFAYYTPYRHDSHGRDCQVYKFRRGDLYDNFVRFFEQLWEAGSTVAPRRRAPAAPQA